MKDRVEFLLLPHRISPDRLFRRDFLLSMFTQSQSRAKTAKYLRLKEFVFVYKELKKRGKNFGEKKFLNLYTDNVYVEMECMFTFDHLQLRLA